MECQAFLVLCMSLCMWKGSGFSSSCINHFTMREIQAQWRSSESMGLKPCLLYGPNISIFKDLFLLGQNWKEAVDCSLHQLSITIRNDNQCKKKKKSQEDWEIVRWQLSPRFAIFWRPFFTIKIYTFRQNALWRKMGIIL